MPDLYASLPHRPSPPIPAHQPTSFPSGLEDLLDLEGADDFGEGQLDAVEAERRRKDPLSQLDLPAHIRGVLGQYAAASPDGLRAAAAEMSPMQQQTLQQILM